MTSSSMSETRFLDRTGGRIAFDVRGPRTGPLVVCIPGMGDVRSVYRDLADSLAEVGFRVAVMDLRGHGESDATFGSQPEDGVAHPYGDEAAAADALALVDELGGPAVLVGNSMGAGAAVIAASRSPQTISSLVLIGPFVRDVPQPAALRWMLRVAMAGPWSNRAWLAYLPKLYPSRRGEEFRHHRAEIAAALRKPGHAAAFRATTRAGHAQAWQAVRDVHQPVLVVMGTADPDFPDPAAEATLVADALRAEMTMVDGAGHYPHAERPDLTTPAVARFLQGALDRA